MTRKSRKGRPRKHNVSRTPKGRISHEPAENPMQTAIEARQRIHGLTPTLAVDQKAGSVLGRMCLAGDISEAQYEAGLRFHKAHAEMLRATLGPRGLETPEPAASGDVISDDYINWAIAAVSNYRVAKDRLSLPEWFAVQCVVLEDRVPLSYMPVTVALTVLATGYGLIGNREKVA